MPATPNPVEELLTAAADVAAGAGEIVAELEQKNASLERENQALREKLAQQERLTLEKVAGTVVDPNLARQTVDRLVACSYLDAGQAAKVAAAIQSNPNEALHIVQRLIEHGPAHEEGSGTSFSANATKSAADNDGWSEVARKGAV